MYKNFLIYKIFACIKYLILYIKDKNLIGPIFYSDGFNTIIQKYLKVHLKTDWIGRQYGILNPMIDINGKLNMSTMIVEIDGENTNNDEQVKTWIMKQLLMVGNLFKIQNLYNFIDFDLKPVGPINSDNYLIIFDMSSRKMLHQCIVSIIKQIILYGVLIGIGLFVFFNYFN